MGFVTQRLLPWLGIALLASATLLTSGALGDYTLVSSDPNSMWSEATWTALPLFVLGVLLTIHVRWPAAPGRRLCLALAALLVPALFVLDGTDLFGPALVIAGLLLIALRNLATEDAWLPRIGEGLAFSGTACSVSALTVFVHGAITARVPQLPDFLVSAIAKLASIVGIDAAVDGKHILMFSMREKHALATTWTWFADPALCAFLVVGALLLIASSSRGRAQRITRFAVLGVVWLFARALLSMTSFMHTALRTDYDAPLTHASQFWNAWYGIALLVPLAVLAAWLVAPVHRPLLAADDSSTAKRRPWLPIAASALASFALVVGYFWTPSGPRKQGRILVSELHSTVSDWTRWRWHHKDKDTTSTLRPYDTEWYGEAAAYNFASLYEYCSRFYEIDRLTTRISDEALANCDVLVLKVPTLYYEKAEIAAVHRFVEAGGGLMLIGEHTSVFGSGVTLNQIARKYGFEFRYDSLFAMANLLETDPDKVFSQQFRQFHDEDLMPHAASQHMGPIEFAVSCSIDPGTSSGDAVVRGIGLESLDADYHAANAYPQPDDVANMLPGSFVQAWSTESGRGRVLAFTDSTILANFSFFEPGKSELFLGMMEWLNHEQGLPTLWLRALGWLAALLTLLCVLAQPACALGVVSTAIGSTALAVLAVQGLNASSLPLPERIRPVVSVGLDGSLCTLAGRTENGFTKARQGYFGLFDRNFQRLTEPQSDASPGLPWITRRVKTLASELDHDMLVMILPNVEASDAERAKIEAYVKGGGKLFVLDDATNESSQSNALLAPFGLRFVPNGAGDGEVQGETLAMSFPKLPVKDTVAVEGGKGFVSAGGKVVAACTKYGEGAVYAIGFASRFDNLGMGGSGDLEPSEEARKAYEFQYELLRQIHSGSLLTK